VVDTQPFFIVGSPRSGTTLLRFLLSTHPRLYIPDETGFIPFLLPERKLDSELSLKQVQRLLRRIGRLNYLWDGLVTNPQDFYLNLTSHSLGDVLDGLFRIVVKPYGAARWGDKTPLYVRYMPLIHKIFPEARFIHVIRDGRDATLSAQRKWGLAQQRYMDNYYLLQNWVTNVSDGARDGASLGAEWYLEVHYESLVEHPEDISRLVCDFLQEAPPDLDK
jgi:hypothetical protein